MNVLLLRTEEGYVSHLEDVRSLELTLAGRRRSTLIRTTRARGLDPLRSDEVINVDPNKELLVKIRSRKKRVEEPVPMGTTILVAEEGDRHTKTEYVSLAYVSGVLLPDKGFVEAPAKLLAEAREEFQAGASTH